VRRVLVVVLALGLVATMPPSATALQTATDLPVRVGGNIPPPTKVKDAQPADARRRVSEAQKKRWASSRKAAKA
jgi:hypothetical protein